MEKWQPQSGKAKSTSTGGGGGAGSGGASSGSGNQQSAQQDQQGQQKQQKEERAMQVVMHEEGGAYAVIGKGDDGVRYAAHEKGAKVRAGKENYFVAEKDKNSIMRAKKDVYVTSKVTTLRVCGEEAFREKPWVIKEQEEKRPGAKSRPGRATVVVAVQHKGECNMPGSTRHYWAAVNAGRAARSTDRVRGARPDPSARPERRAGRRQGLQEAAPSNSCG